jgi:hypothetical protein
MWIIRALLVLVAFPVCAAAQVLEAGGGIGRGCTGDSSGFCGDDSGAMWAVHGSVWLDDRVEIGVRLATLPRPDYSYATARDDRFNLAPDPAIRQLPRIDVMVSDRSRQILSAEVLYHFARSRPVRGFLGLGLGERTDRFEQRCAPAGCETLMPILSFPVGRGSSRGGNITMVAGISGRISKRWLMRGGIRLHNFAGEEQSTSEVFVATGYQFGRR